MNCFHCVIYCMYLDAGPPSPADHLRQVFYRMGLNDKVIFFLFIRIKVCKLDSSHMSNFDF